MSPFAAGVLSSAQETNSAGRGACARSTDTVANPAVDASTSTSHTWVRRLTSRRSIMRRRSSSAWSAAAERKRRAGPASRGP
ncbi:MAG: hypothetical protein EBT97_07105 [Actinobacteria bacterium]|nr:hypothetical protein [Actinomycetota bacterium]